jgi:hypothetical protein
MGEMSDMTFEDRAGSVAAHAKGFLAKAREAAGDLVERMKEMSEELVWINHLRLTPVGTGLMATYDAVGTGLSGLVISPRTAGPLLKGQGYLLETALEVPPGYFLRGVRIGMESSSRDCYLNLIRLAQVNDPPDSAVLLGEDERAHRAVGARSVDSEDLSVDPRRGPVLLTLGFGFEDPGGWVVVRSVGMRLSRNPA